MPPLRVIWFSLISFSYTILLMGTALIGFKLTTQSETGTSALFLPIILAVLSLTLTIMSLMIERNYKVGVIGIHLLLALPLLSAALLGIRAWDLYQVGKQGTQVTLDGMMAVTSVYVFVTMVLIRPKKLAEPTTIGDDEAHTPALRDRSSS
jgi:hypothetical protein